MLSFTSLEKKNEQLAVVGLGYVGLPLAVHLARHFKVVGFDRDTQRIAALRTGVDHTREVDTATLASVDIGYSADSTVLTSCRMIIVAVPTPIDRYRIPDLGPLKSAAETVGSHLQKDSCVVFESTVYPGATEEVCIPILEKTSGLAFGRDFTVGYSPERINPGDKVHTLEKVTKIVSGSDPATTDLLQAVYGRVVKAGIHCASSIKVAEAAKVIENTQRDLNIALMNELSMIFDTMDIDTREVLAAAGTKWNFMPFQPGLVGGHCIGVDPYYLTFKAESLGYHPAMILAGRRINDGMGKYVAERTVKELIRAGKPVQGAQVAVLGVTFKENVPDLRNTRITDIVTELEDFGVRVKIHDPYADKDATRSHLGVRLNPLERLKGCDAVILAVCHKPFLEMGLSAVAGLCGSAPAVVIDVKGGLSSKEARKAGIRYWRL